MLETRSFVPRSLVSGFAEDAFSSIDMLVSIFSDLSEDNILLAFVTAFFILCLFGEMVEKDPEGWGEGKKRAGIRIPFGNQMYSDGIWGEKGVGGVKTRGEMILLLHHKEGEENVILQRKLLD